MSADGEPTDAPADPRPLRVAARLFIGAAAVLLFAMMTVTTVDVIGRYLLSRPLPGASEINQILLGLIIYLSLPAACLHQEHIMVGLIFDRLGPQARRIAGTIINLAGALLLGVVGRELLAHGDRLASYADVTIYLRLPTGPLAHIMAMLSMVSTLILLTNAMLIAAGHKSPTPLPSSEESTGATNG